LAEAGHLKFGHTENVDNLTIRQSAQKLVNSALIYFAAFGHNGQFFSFLGYNPWRLPACVRNEGAQSFRWQNTNERALTNINERTAGRTTMLFIIDAGAGIQSVVTNSYNS
jgi:hypothetical protein